MQPHILSPSKIPTPLHVLPPMVIDMDTIQEEKGKELLFKLLNMYRADIKYIKEKLDDIAKKLKA